MGVSKPLLPASVALVALTAEGADLARRLAPELPGARVHGLSGRAAKISCRFGPYLKAYKQLEIFAIVRSNIRTNRNK